MAKITLATEKINGKQYGIGECVVKFGHNEYEAIAVKAGKEKFVGLPNGVLDWLTERGLARDEAVKFMHDGLANAKMIYFDEAVKALKKERKKEGRAKRSALAKR